MLVLEVMPDSAAEKAGIIPTRPDAMGEMLLGDLIVSIDDEKIKNRNELFAALDRHKVGETVSITVLRNGREVQVEVTLQALDT